MVVAIERSRHSGEKTSILQQHHINWDHNESSKSCKRSIKFQFQRTTLCKNKWNAFNFDYKNIANYHKSIGNHILFGSYFLERKKIHLLQQYNIKYYEMIEKFQGKKSSMLQYILEMWMLNMMESINHLQQGHKMNLHQRYKMNLEICNQNIMCKNFKNGLQCSLDRTCWFGGLI